MQARRGARCIAGGFARLSRRWHVAVVALGGGAGFRSGGAAGVAKAGRAARAAVPGLVCARCGASGGALSMTLESRGLGARNFIDRARAYVRTGIEATFPPLGVPMARALVLGESDLDPDDDVAFRASGLSHLLAVSGTHLVFAVVTLVNALSFFLVRIEAFSAYL